MTLGERLKYNRTKADLTQREVNKKTGINYKTLSNWENDVSKPSPDDLIILANTYNVTTDYLLGRTDEPQGTGFQKGDNGGSQNDGEREKIPPHRKDYVELHRLIDELPHKDVEELLNTALFKKRKAEHLHEHVDDPDDF